MEHTRFIWWRRKYISNFWFRIWHLCLFWLQLFWKIVNKKCLHLSALFMEHTHSSFPTSINYLLLTCNVRLRYRRCSSRHEFPNENVLITTFLQGCASIQTRTVSQSFIWFCINFQDNNLQHFQKRKNATFATSAIVLLNVYRYYWFFKPINLRTAQVQINCIIPFLTWFWIFQPRNSFGNSSAQKERQKRFFLSISGNLMKVGLAE